MKIKAKKTRSNALLLQSLAVITAGTIAGCGAGGSSVALAPTAPKTNTSVPSSAQKQGTANFVLTIPNRTTAAHARSTKFVSPSTATVTIATLNGTAITATTTASVTPNSAGCTTVSGVTTCTISVTSVPSGTTSFVVTALDASGNVLSKGTVAAVIGAGSVTNVPIALDGVVNAVRLVASASTVNGTSSTTTVTLNAYDPAGNIIVGGGNYLDPNLASITFPLTFSGSTSSVAASASTITSPATNVVTLTNASAFTGQYGVKTTSSTNAALTTGVTLNYLTAATTAASVIYGKDSSGNVYAFAPGGNGPIRTLPTLYAPQTAMYPQGYFSNQIAADSKDTIFIAQATSVSIYPSSTYRNGAPVAVLNGFTGYPIVCVDGNDNLYVLDTGTGAITKYASGSYTTPNATYTSTFSADQTLKAMSFAVNAAGAFMIVLAPASNNGYTVSSGTITGSAFVVSSTHAFGNGSAQITQPSEFAVDMMTGNTYVGYNSSVLVYNANNTYQNAGKGPAAVLNVSGGQIANVSVGPDGTVYAYSAGTGANLIGAVLEYAASNFNPLPSAPAQYGTSLTASPSRSIESTIGNGISNTSFNYAGGDSSGEMGLSSNGHLFFTGDTGSIEVFAAGATGDATPIKALESRSPYIGSPQVLAVGANALYAVSQPYTGYLTTVNAYTAAATGSTVPLSSDAIPGSGSRQSQQMTVVTDTTNGNVWVADGTNIKGYAAGGQGFASAPFATLASSSNIIAASSNSLFVVTGYSPQSIAEYDSPTGTLNSATRTNTATSFASGIQEIFVYPNTSGNGAGFNLDALTNRGLVFGFVGNGYLNSTNSLYFPSGATPGVMAVDAAGGLYFSVPNGPAGSRIEYYANQNAIETNSTPTYFPANTTGGVLKALAVGQ